MNEIDNHVCYFCGVELVVGKEVWEVIDGKMYPTCGVEWCGDE